MDELYADGDRPRILHVFADYGVEAETLGCYGDVVRVGINAKDTNDSHAIRADAHDLPFSEGTTFDFALMHPPCTRWSEMPGANKNGDAPNLIPLAREIGERYCDYWVIENKPRAPLEDPLLLDGKMFALPIAYERAFESNFEMEAPPRQATLVETETSPYYYPERTPAWWASVKGVTVGRYPKQHVAKNCLPAPYIHHIAREWLAAAGRAVGASDYTDYEARQEAKRNGEENHTLAAYTTD